MNDSTKHIAKVQSGGVAGSCTYLVWGDRQVYLASSSDGLTAAEIEALAAALPDRPIDAEDVKAIWDETIQECYWPGWEEAEDLNE